MNNAGPSLIPEEDKTSAKFQNIVGSMNDGGPYSAPKEDSKTFTKHQHIIAWYVQHRAIPCA